jgi:hypothetical protein
MKKDHSRVTTICAAHEKSLLLGVCAGTIAMPSTSGTEPIESPGSSANYCVFDPLSCWAKAALAPAP